MGVQPARGGAAEPRAGAAGDGRHERAAVRAPPCLAAQGKREGAVCDGGLRQSPHFPNPCTGVRPRPMYAPPRLPPLFLQAPKDHGPQGTILHLPPYVQAPNSAAKAEFEAASSRSVVLPPDLLVSALNEHVRGAEGGHVRGRGKGERGGPWLSPISQCSAVQCSHRSLKNMCLERGEGHTYSRCTSHLCVCIGTSRRLHDSIGPSFIQRQSTSPSPPLSPPPLPPPPLPSLTLPPPLPGHSIHMCS